MERQCLWPDCDAAPVVVMKTPGEPNEYLCEWHATDAEEILASITEAAAGHWWDEERSTET